eukprot:SAG22_NODE_1258_length_4983_cov_2.401925_3_plen_136_part_00
MTCAAGVPSAARAGQRQPSVPGPGHHRSPPGPCFPLVSLSLNDGCVRAAVTDGCVCRRQNLKLLKASLSARDRGLEDKIVETAAECAEEVRDVLKEADNGSWETFEDCATCFKTTPEQVREEKEGSAALSGCIHY